MTVAVCTDLSIQHERTGGREGVVGALCLIHCVLWNRRFCDVGAAIGLPSTLSDFNPLGIRE
jgi:hypothetical protein